MRATIDALLKTPSGPFGGEFEEADVGLFDLTLDLLGAGPVSCKGPLAPMQTCEGKVIEYPDFAFPLLRPLDGPGSSWGFTIDEYASVVALPEIAPFGELTVYYDMYALVRSHRESGGRAALGDPIVLSEGGGSGGGTGGSLPFQLIELPEPQATLLLLAGVALAAARRASRSAA